MPPVPQPPADAAPDSDKTAIGPVLALSAAIVAGWSAWVLVFLPSGPNVAAKVGVVTSVLARTVFWLLPCGVYLWRHRERPWHEMLGLGFPGGRRQIFRTLALTLGVALLFFMARATHHHEALGAFVLGFFGRAHLDLAAPVFEELVFRGLILGELLNWARDSGRSSAQRRRRFWGSLLLGTMIFVVVHWAWWFLHLGWILMLVRSPLVLLFGLSLGVVFAITRSVWACIFLHWLNNQIGLVG